MVKKAENSKTKAGYVVSPSRKILREIDSLLDSTAKSSLEILARYRALRRKHKLCALPHSDKALDLVAQIVGSKPYQRNEIRSLLGSHAVITDAIGRIALRLKKVPSLASGHRSSTPDELSRWVYEELGPVPETFLDSEYGDAFERPPIAECIRIQRIQVPQLRMLAALGLYYIYDPSMDPHNWTKLIMCICRLDKDFVLAGAHPKGEGDGPWQITNAMSIRALENLLNDTELSTSYRANAVRVLRKAIALIAQRENSYIDFAARYKRFKINLPLHNFKAEIKNLKEEALDAALLLRDGSCEAIANDLQKFYKIIENRFALVAAIRAAFDEQCLLIKDKKVILDDGESHFYVMRPRQSIVGLHVEGTWRLNFAVVTREKLLSSIERTPGISKGCEKLDDFYLVYHGSDCHVGSTPANVDGSAERNCDEPPILTMFRQGCFLSFASVEREAMEARKRLLPPSVWPHNRLALALLKFVGKEHNTLQVACFRAGITVLPVKEWHFATAMGRAVSRSILRGARVGEVVQQNFSQDCFVEHEYADSTMWKWMAIGKKRTTPEPFFLSPRDMEAVIDLIDCAKANGWKFHVVAPHPAQTRKCGPSLYLYQRNGVRLLPQAVAFSINILFWPTFISSHDLRHGMARYLAACGVPYETLAKILHHSVRELGQTRGRRDRRSGRNGATWRYVRSTAKSRAGLMRILLQSGIS